MEHDAARLVWGNMWAGQARPSLEKKTGFVGSSTIVLAVKLDSV